MCDGRGPRLLTSSLSPPPVCVRQMNELDLEDKAADRHLREHNGDVRAALRALVQ